MSQSVCAQTGGTDRIGKAKQAVRDLFPELNGRGLPLVIADGSTLDGKSAPLSFDLNVSEPRLVIKPEKNCSATPLISVGFQFTMRGHNERLFAFNAGGPAVNSQKREDLGRVVDSHPEWSDIEVQEALFKAGARFGPNAKGDFEKTLPLPALSRLLDANVEVLSLEFRFRDKAQMQEHLASATLLWAVGIAAHPHQGDDGTHYYAQFEPFDGKLVSLIKTPPVP